MKILVLGIGNPILCDDGVGIRVAEEIRKRNWRSDVTVLDAGVGGLELLDLLVGFDRAYIIDAIKTMNGKPGDIYRLSSDDFNATRYATSPHSLNFATALELGKKLNMPLPSKIDIFAVEVIDTLNFSEECTPDVHNAVLPCAEMVLSALETDQAE